MLGVGCRLVGDSLLSPELGFAVRTLLSGLRRRGDGNEGDRR
jgi:hypothetical protein